MLLLFLAINFGISCWNVYVTGVTWAETGAVGGWRRFMAWMGAIMSATGFTWSYLTVLALVFYGMGWLNADGVKLAMELAYIVLVPGLLFAGYAIMLDSWARTFREGGYVNWGVSIYNTWANYHNTMSVVNSYGGAFGDVFKNFTPSKDDDGKGTAALIVLFLVVLAACLGIITTVVAIKKLSASHPLPKWDHADREGSTEDRSRIDR
jgi:hypothetical protein